MQMMLWSGVPTFRDAAKPSASPVDSGQRIEED